MNLTSHEQLRWGGDGDGDRKGELGEVNHGGVANLGEPPDLQGPLTRIFELMRDARALATVRVVSRRWRAAAAALDARPVAWACTRPLLGWSTLCGMRWVYCGVSVMKTARVELRSGRVEAPAQRCVPRSQLPLMCTKRPMPPSTRAWQGLPLVKCPS